MTQKYAPSPKTAINISRLALFTTTGTRNCNLSLKVESAKDQTRRSRDAISIVNQAIGGRRRHSPSRLLVRTHAYGWEFYNLLDRPRLRFHSQLRFKRLCWCARGGDYSGRMHSWTLFRTSRQFLSRTLRKLGWERRVVWWLLWITGLPRR